VAIDWVIVAVIDGTAAAPPPKPNEGAMTRLSKRPTVCSLTDRAVAQRRVPGKTNGMEQQIASTAARRTVLERSRLIDFLLKKRHCGRAGERWATLDTRSDGLTSDFSGC